MEAPKNYNDGVLYGIKCCNADYQLIIQQMHHDFSEQSRIRKKDMESIMSAYASVELGQDVNPYLEDVSD